MPAFVTVRYIDGDPATYQGFALRMYLGEVGTDEVFHTGDPTVDYLTVGALVHLRAGPAYTIMGSSSIDHFVMDGGRLEDDNPPQEKMDRALKIAEDYMRSRGEKPHPRYGGG